jgi:dihydroorotate dehydrogenase
LFRLKEDSAIINRMGFNNGGVQTVERLKQNKRFDW